MISRKSFYCIRIQQTLDLKEISQPSISILDRNEHEQHVGVTVIACSVTEFLGFYRHFLTFPGGKTTTKKNQEFSNPGTRSESSFRRRSLENLPGAGPAGRCCWRHQWVLTVDRGWLMGCIKNTCRNMICYG